MADTKSASTERQATDPQHGVFLTVDEIERLTVAFRQPRQGGSAAGDGGEMQAACGIIICGT